MTRCSLWLLVSLAACSCERGAAKDEAARRELELLVRSTTVFQSRTRLDPSSIEQLFCVDTCALPRRPDDPWGTPYRLVTDGGLVFSTAGRDTRWDTADDLHSTLVELIESRERPCASDRDCPAGHLCACATTACSICQSTNCYSHLTDTCVSRHQRLESRIPIHVDGGWRLEVLDAGSLHESAEAAFLSGEPLR